MMKKLVALLLALLLLAGCSGQGAEPGPSEIPVQSPAAAGGPGLLWTGEELPVEVDYQRMWVYSASARTDDPALIAQLVAAVQALEIGEKSEERTEDYTDLLLFRFADGEELRLEFENQCWVTQDNERYEVRGLGPLREILDRLIGETD